MARKKDKKQQKKKAEEKKKMQESFATDSKAENYLQFLSIVIVTLGFVLRFVHSSLYHDSTITLASESAGLPPMPSFNRLITLVLMAGLALWFLSIYLKGEIRLLKTGVLSGIFLAIFMFVTWVHVPIAEYTLPAFDTAVDTTVFFLVFIFVVNMSIDKRLRIGFLCLLIASFAGAAVAGLAEIPVREQAREIVQKSAEIYSTGLVNRVNASDVYSYFINPNTLGTIMAMGICLGAGLILELIRRKNTGNFHLVRLITVCIVTAVMLVTLFLSHSKGGIVACLIGLFVIAVLVIINRIKKYQEWYAFGMLGLMLISLVVFTIVMVKTSDPSWMGDSMKVRHGYWRSAGNMIRYHGMLGVGGGNYHFEYPTFRVPEAEMSTFAHNIYIQLFNELGIAGLLFFFLFFASIISRTFEPVERMPSTRTAELFKDGRQIIISFIAGIILAMLIIFLITSPKIQHIGYFGLLVLPAVFLLLQKLEIFSPKEDTANPDSGIENYSFFFKDSWLTAGIAGAFFVFLWHNLIDFSYYSKGVQLSFFIISAVLIASVAPQRPQDYFIRKLGGLRHVLIIAVFALIVLYAMFTTKTIRADREYAQAATPFREGIPAFLAGKSNGKEMITEAENHLAKASDLVPGDMRYKRELFWIALNRFHADPSLETMKMVDLRADVLFQTNPNMHKEKFYYALAKRKCYSVLSTELNRQLQINAETVLDSLDDARRLNPSNARRSYEMWKFLKELIENNPESAPFPTTRIKQALNYGNDSLLLSKAAPVKEYHLKKSTYDEVENWITEYSEILKKKEKEMEEKFGKKEKPDQAEKDKPKVDNNSETPKEGNGR